MWQMTIAYPPQVVPEHDRLAKLRNDLIAERDAKVRRLLPRISGEQFREINNAFLPKIIPVIEAQTTLQRRFGVFGWKQVSD
jgi:hypothetical protein